MHTRTRIACGLLLFAAASSSLPQESRAQSTTTHGWTKQFDIRQAQGRTDRLGLDFDLGYSAEKPPVAPNLNSFGLTFRGKGFETFNRATRDVNAMSAEMSLQGWRYTSHLLTAEPRAPEQIIEIKRILEKQGEGHPLTPAEEKDLNHFLDDLRKGRTFFTYGAQYRLETTQDIKVSDNVFGAHVTAEIPLLGALLDAIPSTTRGADNQRLPFPVRAYVAIEYVKPQERRVDQPAALDSAAFRARTEVAWSTIVFDKLILRTTWEAHYLFDSENRVGPKRHFENFFQSWIKVPMTVETGIIVKYIAGSLPPTYKNSTVAALGLNFSFYP